MKSHRRKDRARETSARKHENQDVGGRGACRAPAPPGAGPVFENHPSTSRTSPARGPLVDSSGVNSTRWPSRSSSNTAPRTELRWKKCSMPPSSRMNPNPLSMRRRAIVPVGIPEALRSDPRGNPAGIQPATDDSYEERAPPSRAGRPKPLQLLVELEIGASLGSTKPEVKKSNPAQRRLRQRVPRTLIRSLASVFRGPEAGKWTRSA